MNMCLNETPFGSPTSPLPDGNPTVHKQVTSVKTAEEGEKPP